MLKPCPFCGSPARIDHTEDPELLIRLFVQCTGVGCWARIDGYRDEGQAATLLVAAWNRRAS